MKSCHYPIQRFDDSTEGILWDNVSELSVSHYQWLDNGYAPEVKAALAYTSGRLHLQFRIYESMPKVSYYTPNEPVCKDSCVEFFVQPLPDSDPRYVNFELNAAGTLLLKLGENRHDRIFLEEPEPDAFRIRTMTECKDPIDGRDYWLVSLSIPFAWLQSLFPSFQPKPGHRLRGNLYKCGDETPLPHFGSWSPVTSDRPDFHRSCDFGDLVLG
ncbi:carbohydrate-binding family 9-like protein [Paenibacillus sp. GD4]|uniref:carbohydrate-binding family 9-like protein n=1 Tax=Paenibacillus sp. GD4 TaxID=3068890 RepID=UPI0027965B77|nr:carbohydrate-binding family 9-like protein [Paenibacillus sp. GD4]MDQ1914472.1 carbohydrate-binding family 9-like protein [Paenibacillus sp. GD4]